jgi:chitodextrinase
LVETSAAVSSISLSWQPSLDNVGVAGYTVYSNGNNVGATGLTLYSVSNLSCGQSYTLAVDAYDASGNHSPQTSVVASTAPCDTQAPSAPSGLSASSATANSLSLNWSAASDNVGVAGYDLYLNGSKVGTTTTTSYGYAGLSCGTSYTLAVAAYDAAGNRSPQASLAAATSACPTPPSASSGAPGTGIGLVAFGSTLQQTLSSWGSNYSYVLFGGDYSVAQSLPGKTLHYQDGTAVNTQWNDGIPYSEASANGWMLKDAAGNYIHVYGDSSRYLLDVGNPAAQQAYINDTLLTLQAHPGVDGVELDNIQTDIGAITRGVYPAKYPSLSAYQNAEVSFLAAVGPALRNAGYYMVANAGGYVNDSSYDSGQDTNSFWTRIAPYLGGLMNEYWMQNANSVTQLMDDSGAGFMHSWSGWQKLVTTAQAGGADFLGVSIGSSSDLRTMRFGKGSFLLDWNGQGGAFLYAIAPAFTSGISPWNPAWTTDIGTPTGSKYQVATKVWRRDFTKGTVVVNPTASSVTISVNGSSYTIAPTDALIAPS